MQARIQALSCGGVEPARLFEIPTPQPPAAVEDVVGAFLERSHHTQVWGGLAERPRIESQNHLEVVLRWNLCSETPLPEAVHARVLLLFPMVLMVGEFLWFLCSYSPPPLDAAPLSAAQRRYHN